MEKRRGINMPGNCGLCVDKFSFEITSPPLPSFLVLKLGIKFAVEKKEEVLKKTWQRYMNVELFRIARVSSWTEIALENQGILFLILMNINAHS